MKKNVLLIVNPISGDIDKLSWIEAVKEFVSRNNYQLFLYETSTNNDHDNILNLCEKISPERVLIIGGDGTIKLVAEALENFDVKFGIIPAGSANGLAVDLNLPLDVQECIAIAFGDNFMSIDMVNINGKKSLHLSDLGLNAQLIKNYENGSTRGMLGYAIQAIGTLVNLEDPFFVEIECNNQVFKSEARMVVIANSQKYGTGVTINPNGLINDGKFEIIVLKNLDLIVLGKIIAGNMPIETGDVEIFSTTEAVIKASNDICFQIDGEFIGQESHLDVKILPNKMLVAVS